ncbi:hypothetical protein CHLRE_16g670501v5 [Chlamydomonas reinhardtii]|uniref:Uncharacterized protein n=1 Tax=Chlamydomonas reinhardtii TaxID=3055 RepID=A0A2K3CU86_CHLRE|nr:uncharacterized protein CHLRE_16g670501v5 [Chlamydomonas reinhardtii]PNW71849.1 hypothetical protein CHLRE_16g670501v5 [Chlamydomonas reinhardtii]
MSSPSTSELRRAACPCGTTLRRGWAPRPGARLLLYRACVGNRGNVMRLVASATASAPLRAQLGSKRPRAADAPSDEARLAATPAPASAPPGHQHTAGPSPGDTPPQPQHAPHARGPAFAAPRPPPPHTRAPAGPHPTINVGDGVSLRAAAAAANAAAAATHRHPVPAAHTGPVPTVGTLGLPALPAELPGGGSGGASGAGGGAAAAVGSHTEPANARLSAHGCYRVLGPAVIRRRGDMLVARLLPGARLELMEADGAAAAMRPAFQATATASAGAAAAAAAASRSSVSSSSSGSSGSSGSMDGPVDLASLGLVICNSPNGGGGGGGGGTSRDDSGLGVELPLRRCLVAAAAGDSLDGEDDNAAEMDLYGNGSGSSCGCVMVAAGAAAAVALNQQRQPRQQARPNESSKEVWEATEAEEAPADGATRPRYMAAGAAAGRGGAQPAPAPAPLLLPLPLPAACGHPPPRPCAPSHQATQQEQQAVGVGGEEGGVGGEEGGVGGEEGGGDAAAGWGLLTAGCDDDEDDGAVAECVLVAAHVELGGSACSVDQLDAALHPAVTRHNGRTYVAVRRLPPHAVIRLHADGDLSHPVNVTPPPPPPQPPQP